MSTNGDVLGITVNQAATNYAKLIENKWLS
jgi:hypothetical protein